MKQSKIFCVLLCITVLFSTVFPIPTYAATSGIAGGCQWSLDGTVLTITGNGKLATPYGNGPWGNYITEAIIGEGITSVEVGVFSGCKYLTKVTLPASLRAIKQSAFSDCTALTSVKMPEGVTTIDTYAFANCASLLDIHLPRSVIDIGLEVFQECYSLTHISVAPDNPSFVSVDGVLYSKDRTVLIRYPADKIGDSYTVPDGVKEISNGAFEAAWNLFDIYLPAGITKIGLQAFYKTVPFNDRKKVVDGCFYMGEYLISAKDENMTTCTVRKGTKLIAEGAFVATEKLEEITLPEGLTHIGDSAFSWCYKLKNISLPLSIKTVENSAFYDCNAITNVYYAGNQKDRNQIWIGSQNENFINAAWKYNRCQKGNDHSWWKVSTSQKPTCTEGGTTQKTCSVCSVTVYENVAPVGHAFGRWYQTKTPNCAEAGKEEHVCLACGTVERRAIDPLQHVFGPWNVEIQPTCDAVGVEKRTCTLCQHIDARNIAPLGHNLDQWELEQKPTCTKEGKEKAVCKTCGMPETRSIPAAGHTFGEARVVKKPTTKEAGLKVSTCKVCETVQNEVLEKMERERLGIVTYICIAAAVLTSVAAVVGYIMYKKRKA